jgi:hypothetical protein
MTSWYIEIVSAVFVYDSRVIKTLVGQLLFHISSAAAVGPDIYTLGGQPTVTCNFPTEDW